MSLSSHQCSFHIFVNYTPSRVSHPIAFAFSQFIQNSKVFLSSTKMYWRNQWDYLVAAITYLLPAWARLPPWRIWYCSVIILNRNFLRTGPFRGCFRRFLTRTLLVRDRVNRPVAEACKNMLFAHVLDNFVVAVNEQSFAIVQTSLPFFFRTCLPKVLKGPLSRMHCILLVH